ncbi:hypothetical protein WICPIJ_000571 [Wickerhamomyces pijperi]|uniref:F-box domain-containing protein n=1 Tax=Wickerhamomyces pijperi TaxID=599730 RepID=A0A9P8QD86_WICPI|nr:hypothetical protein WICPIJ_000571 [Wickerhamomyces pijperi]
MDFSLSCNDTEDSKKEQTHRKIVPTEISDKLQKINTDTASEQDPLHHLNCTKTLIPSDNFGRYCYRHNPDVKCNKQTDLSKFEELQGTIEKLPRSEQNAINNIWSTFSASSSSNRNLIIQGLLTQCCFPQLSFISQEISSLIRIDFISTLPLELSLKILCYLDCNSLCNAAQVSKNWKSLADDDRVWHHMCEQHIDRKCPNCGWGLPLMHMKRAREVEVAASSSSSSCANKNSSNNFRAFTTKETSKRRKITPVDSTTNDPAQLATKNHRKTRPWKTVYSERFQVERNWRKGTYTNLIEFQAHNDGVLTLKYDHKHLFTGSYDKSVKIWDINTGKHIRTLTSHSQGVKSLVFDEQKLITGSLDKTIKVWNYHTGQCISTYRGHLDAVLSVDCHKVHIASGSADTTVKLWNVESRTCHALRGHTEAVNCVKIHPKSMTVFSASDDMTVKMWDIGTQKCLRTFKGHVGQVMKVIPLSLSKDYDLVRDEDEETEGENIVEEGDQEDQPEGANQQDGDNENEPELVDLSDPSMNYPNYILTASLDNTIKLWDVKTEKCIRTQFGHVEGIWDISCDTFRIVSGAHDRLVKIWDLQSGKCMLTFNSHSNSGAVSCVGLGDESFVSGDESGVVKIYNFDVIGN